jgi:hypothetical protein
VGNVKELDFDELDRAVNSLITSTPAEPKAADAEKTVTITPTLGDNDQPISGALEAAAAQVSDQIAPAPPPVIPAGPSFASAPRSQPLAARRSSGRFMDMVHPSSNMHVATPSAAPVSRQGATLTPPVPPVETPAPEPVTNTTPVSVSPPAPSGATDWPDPLDFHGFTTPSAPSEPVEPVANPSSTANSTPTPREEDDDINQIAQDITSSLNQTEEAPQTSPFLSDAKVDKRPLGAFSAESATTTPNSEPTTEPEAPEPVASSTPVDDPQTPPDGAPLPAELQKDLLSIESSGDHTAATESSVPAVSARDMDEPVGPTSIPQQYKEQPSTGDQQTGNIYDTSSYHKALAHPAKKKSGWMWVVWTFVLLIVGAGAGAAVYFYVLPLLK